MQKNSFQLSVNLSFTEHRPQKTENFSLRRRRFGSRRWCRRGRCRSCMSRRGMSRRRSRHDYARCLRARRAARKRQQRDVARPLNGHAEPALMTRAHARHPPRQNLPALLHELRQDVRALVVDEVHLLDAELAHLLLPEILALAPRPSSGTARTTAAWSGFAPWTTVSSAGSVATMTTGAAFTPRSSAGRWCLFLFLCHTFHPFTRRPDPIGINLLVTPVEPESSFLDSKNSFGARDLAGSRGLLRRCRRRGGSRCATRTPRGALLALLRKFLLALQVFVQSHGLILDHRVLHAQTALQLGNQFTVVRADFLVHVDAFAVLGHAIGKLPRAPVLGLLDLAAFFRDGVLDDREDFFNLLFRRRRPHDENQIVVTLFHDDLFFF